MNKKEIFGKYREIHVSLGGAIYINDGIIENVIHDLYKNNYIVSGYEFLRIVNKYTQPFMEYSVWKEDGYSEEEIYNELSILRKKISKTDLKKEEIFFDILIL